jgi:hypothetical protein
MDNNAAQRFCEQTFQIKQELDEIAVEMRVKAGAVFLVQLSRSARSQKSTKIRIPAQLINVPDQSSSR